MSTNNSKRYDNDLTCAHHTHTRTRFWNVSWKYIYSVHLLPPYNPVKKKNGPTSISAQHRHCKTNDPPHHRMQLCIVGAAKVLHHPEPLHLWKTWQHRVPRWRYSSAWVNCLTLLLHRPPRTKRQHLQHFLWICCSPTHIKYDNKMEYKFKWLKTLAKNCE